MANIVKHKFVSTKVDSSDTTLVRKTEWNEEHIFSGGSNNNILMRDTGQSDGISWTAAPQVTTLALNAALISGSYLSVISTTTTTIPIIARAAASQTADLQQWQLTGGTVIAAMSKDGQLALGAGAFEAMLTATSGASSIVTALLRGTTGQTADLVQLQNVTGTNIFRFSPSAWFTELESTTNPATSDLTANGAVAIYNKANTLVFAYNNAGTMTYLRIALDGSTTAWTHNTTAP